MLIFVISVHAVAEEILKAEINETHFLVTGRTRCHLCLLQLNEDGK